MSSLRFALLLSSLVSIIQMTSCSKLGYSHILIPKGTVWDQTISSFQPMLPNVPITIITVKVNYFPSRYDPSRHAERYPIPPVVLSGKRQKICIQKGNNFKQPREKYRSFSPHRQERFICRWVDALSDPRLTHEIRSIWISYWSQADKSLG